MVNKTMSNLQKVTRVSNLKEATTISNGDVLLVETATETLKVTKENLLKEINQQLNTKSDLSHTHNEYVTESSLNNKGLATETFVTNKITQEIEKTNAQLSKAIIYGEQPPLNPIDGMMWLQSDQHLFKKYSNGQWVIVNPPHRIDVSYFGAKGDGTTDDTEAINDACYMAKYLNINNVYLPNNTYLCNREILNSDGISFVGEGYIKPISRNNFADKTRKKYTQIRQINHFNRETILKAKSLANKFNNTNTPIKIAVWGDSISTTTSSNLHNLKYGAKSIEVCQFTSPDSIINGDSYVSHLISQLLTSFPKNTFSFKNFSIPGLGINDWGKDKMFDGVTKRWIDHIKDYEPDIVIIAFGMNTDNIVAQKYYKTMLDVIDELEQLLTPPLIALLTTPTPANNMDDTIGWDAFGGIEQQNFRYVAASACRAIAKEKGCYLIDVNRLSSIKRYGFDSASEFVSFNKIENLEVGGGSYNQKFLFNNNAIVGLTEYMNDYVVKFKLDLPKWIDKDNYIEIEYDMDTDGGFSKLIRVFVDGINDNFGLSSNNLTNALSFGKFFDNTSFQNSGMTQNSSMVNISDGGTHEFVFEKRGNRSSLFIDNTLVIDDFTPYSKFGYIKIRNALGVDVWCHGLNLFRNINHSYFEVLTEEEMYGEYVRKDYTTREITGGNGANHPSSLGVASVYYPCISEFVNWLSLNI
jgi:lysophospholipase L1-like esterase